MYWKSSTAGQKITEEEGNEQYKEEVTNDKHGVFKYNLDGKILNFEFISNKRVKCPTCGQDFKNILRHLQGNKCQISNLDDLSKKFQQFRSVHLADEIKDEQNNRKAK